MKTPLSTQKKLIAGSSLVLLFIVVLLLNQKNSGQKPTEVTQGSTETTQVVSSAEQSDSAETHSSPSKHESGPAKHAALGSAESDSMGSRSPASVGETSAAVGAVGGAVVGGTTSSTASVGTTSIGTAASTAATAAAIASKPKLSWFQRLFGSSSKGAKTGTDSVSGSVPDGKALKGPGTLNPAAEVAKIDNTPDPGCREIVYTQKVGSKFKNRNHKNFLKIEDEAINLKSVCVRVDGVPARYDHVQEKGKSVVSGLMLGAIAGPESKIVLKYCLHKMNCNDDCAIPKDEFMDAIGGYDAQEDTKAKVVRWDPSDAEADRDVTAEVDSEIKRELAELDMAVSADWTAKVERLSCQMANARKSAPKTGRNVASAPSLQE